jgi:hypothetical protein
MTDFAILIVGAILSFVGGIYIARTYSRRPQLSYLIENALVLRPLGQSVSIEVSYEGKPITNLVESKIAVWNSGTEGFNGNDLVISDPLGFQLNNARIIKVAGPKSSRKAVNAIATNAGDGFVRVIFELLDKKDAFVLVIYSVADDDDIHSRDEYGDITGALSGLPNGFSKVSWRYGILSMTSEITIACSLAIIAGLLLILRAIIVFTPYETSLSHIIDPISWRNWKDIIRFIAMVVIGPAMLLGGTLGLRHQIRKRRQRPPQFVLDELAGKMG